MHQYYSFIFFLSLFYELCLSWTFIVSCQNWKSPWLLSHSIQLEEFTSLGKLILLNLKFYCQKRILLLQIKHYIENLFFNNIRTLNIYDRQYQIIWFKCRFIIKPSKWYASYRKKYKADICLKYRDSHPRISSFLVIFVRLWNMNH